MKKIYNAGIIYYSRDTLKKKWHYYCVCQNVLTTKEKLAIIKFKTLKKNQKIDNNDKYRFFVSIIKTTRVTLKQDLYDLKKIEYTIIYCIRRVSWSFKFFTGTYRYISKRLRYTGMISHSFKHKYCELQSYRIFHSLCYTFTNISISHIDRENMNIKYKCFRRPEHVYSKCSTNDCRDCNVYSGFLSLVW